MTMSVGMYVLPPSRGSKRTTATLHYNEVGQTRQLEGAGTALRQIVCNRSLATDRWLGSCRPSRFFPLILNRRRQLLDAAEEGRNLPDLLVGDRSFPGGHAGVADTVANGIGNMPLRIIERLENELRYWRIKARPKGAGFSIQPTVASGTIHCVELHTVDEIGIGRGNRVVVVRCSALHGSVHGLARQPGFCVARGLIGIGINKAQQSKPGGGGGQKKKGN